MKKFLCFLILALIMMHPTYTHAMFGIRFGYNNQCIIDYFATRQDWYFCGKALFKHPVCSGRSALNGYNRQWLLHGEGFSSVYDNSRHFWCCHGKDDYMGRFVETHLPFQTSEVVTVDLGNGRTCTYERITNVCGDVIDVPCTTPTNCPDGTLFRNNDCVVPCSGTTAFESVTSNKCIECETTNYQGISTDRQCVKCDPVTQFFDKFAKKCVLKTSMSMITATAMKKCYGCPNNQMLKECGLLFSLSESERRAADNYEQIITDCYITDDTPSSNTDATE